jgi:hypothetical protein
MLTNREITKLVALDGRCDYHDTNKQEYKRLGLKLLRALASELGLEPKTFEVRFNPGGVAVSGDAILHSDCLYVTINMDRMGLGILVRTCKGRRDYTGGPNRWFSLERLKTSGLSGLAAFARQVQSEAARLGARS